MHLPFEQFPALSAIKACRHVFTQRIPGIDLSHDKAEVLRQLDASHREIRYATGLGDSDQIASTRRSRCWPLFTAEQIHGNKIAVIDSRLNRLSPFQRGEDEGEGFNANASIGSKLSSPSRSPLRRARQPRRRIETRRCWERTHAWK